MTYGLIVNRRVAAFFCPNHHLQSLQLQQYCCWAHYVTGKSKKPKWYAQIAWYDNIVLCVFLQKSIVL